MKTSLLSGPGPTNVGHMHGGGTGGQVIMIVKPNKDFADLSAFHWALERVARRGDCVIVLVVLNEMKKICPKLQLPFRYLRFGLVCHMWCYSLPHVTKSKRSIEEQVSKTECENYRKMYADLHDQCKSKGVGFVMDTVTTAGHSSQRVAVQKVLASNAEWVILDRDLKKARRYFMKQIPCNLVLMTGSSNPQGVIHKLGPDWTVRRGNCDEGCSSEDKSIHVSGLLLPEKDRKRTISSESSDGTCSGDSDISGRGGDKCPPEKVSKADACALFKELPLLKVGRHGGGTSSDHDDDLFGTPVESPSCWFSGACSPEPQQCSLSTTKQPGTRATVLGVLSLPLCSECRHKVPDFGPPKELTFDEIKEATNSFSSSNHLADCKLGKVYKGFLQDGQAVTVKRLDLHYDTFLGDDYFRKEIQILSLAHHVNVVTLVGYCVDNDERILVFEHACNKALSWHLSPLNSAVLSWSNRRKIALQTGRALCYLHQECRAGSIVHGSVEVGSVLLTHDFSPVLCNFNRAELQPHSDSRPHSNRAPHARRNLGKNDDSATTMSDVYNFGLLLLELIIGGTATDPKMDSIAPGEPSVAASIRSQLDSAYTIVDPELEGRYDDYELFCMIQAASQCLQTDRSLRPPMSKVLSILLGNTREGEIGEDITGGSGDPGSGGASCGHIRAESRFDMISAGVMVF